MRILKLRTRRITDSSGFVVDGDKRLAAGVIAEAKELVKSKYAEEWRTANLMRRLKLRRKITAEAEALAAAMHPPVSPEALF